MIGDEKYSLATDIGKITKSILEKITGSKKILLESNHDVEMLKCGTYPYPLKRRILGEYGHLSNETASKSRSAPCTERHRTHYARSFKQRKQPS